MDEMSSPHSRLALLWVIEYLARFKQIDTSILRDLVKMVPEFSDDLGKNAREMVALRSLEELFGVSDGLTKGSDAPETKAEFDLSASCEDMLQHILQETSLSDIQVGGLKHLKLDVSSFLTHKKACMPKCALEQLKDATAEGFEPFAASLKRTSGITCISGHQKRRLNKSGNASQIIAGEKNLVPLSRENGNELSRDYLCNRNLLPSKRDRSNLSPEKFAGQCLGIKDSAIDGDILHLNSKKNKQDAICTNQPVEQILASLHEAKSLEHNTEGTVRVIKGKGSDLAEDYQAGGVEDKKFPESGHGTDTVMDRIRHSIVNDDQFQNNQMEINHNAPESIQVTCGDEPVCNMILVEVNDSELRTSDSILPATGQNEEISSDNSEFNNEMIDFEMKKSQFLSSQCPLNDESSKIYWTERNLCVKCNEDGHLLVCTISTCPFMVHETCLGSSAILGDNETFLCPFCAYSVAVSKYLKAKKEASLARKALVAFLNVGFEHRLKEYGERLRREEQFHLRKNGNEAPSYKLPENGHLEDGEDNQVGQNCQDVNEISGSQQNKSTGQRDQEPAFSEEEDDTYCKNSKNFPLNKKDVKNKIGKDFLQQQDTLKKPIYDCNTDEEEASEGDSSKHINSDYCIRFRRQEKQRSYPAIPQSRRKKCPWTAEEEDMLRKGVQLFSGDNERQFPWTKILEFGASVFQSSRTPVDLKDKWRNMCRGKSKSK
ncbi:uncharacterized protein LOC110811202 isoform X1 [Carica papaya]|uniref:uncharacterized protein LOC110811202 isoform X1 n=2 Tax=Carica papaya TaxID=3649 RepID=UPI000B8C9D9E|nr:uncharacterized protein LOC110811202 isoform X1 [Carica papaya]